MTTAVEGKTTDTFPEKSTLGQRLMSVDALRGFDMFWIIGADSLVYALHRMRENKTTNFLAYELDHADWEGFHFYDLIFPLFVFIMGVSLVFSLTKTIQNHGRPQAVKRVFIRSILLFALGIIYSGGFSHAWPDIRLMGVLNRIALAYFFGGMLFCFCKPRTLVAICVSLLLGYWALLAFTPIRNIQLERSNLAQLAEQAGDSDTATLFSQPGVIRPGNPAWLATEKMFYSTTNHIAGKDAVATNIIVSDAVTNYVASKYPKGFNVANHFDFQYLPGRKYDTVWDPEGYLSTIPAIATCLLGVFAALLLRSPNYCDKWKVIYLASFGAGAVILGGLWGLEFPVIKKIWTSSYVLVAGGYSALLLAAFYQIVDVWKYQKWCQPFVWMGMNSITVYMTAAIIDEFTNPARRLVGGDIKNFFDNHVAKGFGDLMIAVVGLLLAFLFARLLYKRKVFLRL